MFGRPESQFLKPPPPKRISLPSSQRLNTILEGNQPAAAAAEEAHELSPRIQNARRSYIAYHGFPPLHGDEKPPPSYSQLSSSRGSGADLSVVDPSARYSQSSRLGGASTAPPIGAFSRAKQNLTGRGGWKKLAVVAAIIFFVVVGLVVGLAVGLTQRNKNDDDGPGNDAGDSNPDTGQSAPPAFPDGLWNFDVVLAETDSSCTASADTWSCFPYTTYATSPTASQYSFNWNISQTEAGSGSSDGQHTISSSSNVFSLTFPATPLQLEGAGTADERWTFSVRVAKQTQPTQPLSGDNGQSVCFFNDTTLTGTLYTGSSSSSGGSKAAGSRTAAQRWPGTSFIEQASPGGSGVPDCYSRAGSGGSIGARITQGLGAQPASSRCRCVYESNNRTGAAV